MPSCGDRSPASSTRTATRGISWPKARSLPLGRSINRPLRKPADFARFVGKKAKIRTRHPVGESRRNFSGTLVGVDGDKVKIDVGDQVCEVPVDDVEKANLVYEF